MTSCATATKHVEYGDNLFLLFFIYVCTYVRFFSIFRSILFVVATNTSVLLSKFVS